MSQNTANASKEFLLMEYQQIASAHFQDQNRKIDLLRFYITLVTVPISVIAAALGLRGTSLLSTLPELSRVIGVVVVVIALSGLLLMIMIIDVRFEALIYARTVNLVRKWFADRDTSLLNYLALPITDTMPTFFEWHGATMAEVGLVGLLDSTLAGLGIWFLSQRVDLTAFVFLVYFALHIVLYLGRAYQREKGWKAKASIAANQAKDQKSRL